MNKHILIKGLLLLLLYCSACPQENEPLQHIPPFDQKGGHYDSHSPDFPIEFKYPSIPASQFEKTLAAAPQKVAVILGAGPAGLMTALMLENSHQYDAIIVIEKRTHFSRYNGVAIRDESLPMFEQLGVLKEFKKVAAFSPSARVFAHGKSMEERRSPQQTYPRPNYAQKTSQVFKSFIPRHLIQISALENMLNDKLVTFPNIYILQGTGDISDDAPLLSSMHSVRFVTADATRFDNFLIKEPHIIIVAEGAKSSTREKLGVPVHTQPSAEHWVSGAVSLQGILPPDAPAHVDFTNKPTAIYGFFRPHTSDLFINVIVDGVKIDGKPISPTHGLDNIIRWSAFVLMKLEKNKLRLALPPSAESLDVDTKKSTFFEVPFTAAGSAYHGKNVVFIGDAAGTGSPSGGLGVSLATSMYMHAISELNKGLASDREKALYQYDNRVLDIVDYWQNWIVYQFNLPDFLKNNPRG